MKKEYEYLNDVKMDFSVYSEQKLSESEANSMKNAINKTKKVNYKKLGIIAACVAIVGTLTFTALAKDFIGNIIKTISTGHNEFSQIDPDKLPEMYVGLLFDEDGNVVTEFYPEACDYYDKNGEKIEDVYLFLREEYEKMAEKNGWDVKISESADDKNKTPLERAEENGQNVVKNISEINSGLNFTAKLPEYVPADFTFSFATADGDYLFLYYTNENDEYFVIHERVINEDTAYESGGKKIEETEINGNKAVIVDDSSVAWECDGISVEILGRALLNPDELLNVANSIN